jgi:hypothetical protein
MLTPSWFSVLLSQPFLNPTAAIPIFYLIINLSYSLQYSTMPLTPVNNCNLVHLSHLQFTGPESSSLYNCLFLLLILLLVDKNVSVSFSHPQDPINHQVLWIFLSFPDIPFFSSVSNWSTSHVHIATNSLLLGPDLSLSVLCFPFTHCQTDWSRILFHPICHLLKTSGNSRRNSDFIAESINLPAIDLPFQASYHGKIQPKVIGAMLHRAAFFTYLVFFRQ